MSGRLSEGPAASYEAAFRSNVRQAVKVWRDRLQAPGRVPPNFASIEVEATELRSVAESRGWWAIAQQLPTVVTLCHEAPPALANAVAALALRLDSSDDLLRHPSAGPLGMTVRMTPGPHAIVGPIAEPAVARAEHSDSLSGAQSIALPPLLGDPSGIRPSSGPPPAPGRSEPPLPSISPSGARPHGGPAARASDAVRVASPSPPISPPIAHGPAPPKLLVKEMLGLNAFSKKKGGETRQTDKLLGLQRPAPLAKPQTSHTPSRHSSSPRWPPDAEHASPRVASLRPPKEEAARAKQPAGGRRSGVGRPSTGIPIWFHLLAGAVGFLGIVTLVMVVVIGRDKKPNADLRVVAGSAPRASSNEPAEPAQTAANPLTAEVHSLGEETAQLRSVIDAQSRLAVKCQKDPSQCRGAWTTFAREAMTTTTERVSLAPAPPAEALSAWLLKLKKPEDFPLVEHPLLKSTFDYDSKHIVGHAQFQQTFRRCAAYSDIIESALLKYGAPTWLVALVYQESQCEPLVKSPAGAVGLWQFMPESARAYDLRVVEDEVDERLSPVKSTEAGVRFLTDLHRKLGAWDLALAAYNVGPYGVTARLARVGAQAGFWDLVRSGLLPDETARYVPAIEAHALVLQNLAALDFNRGGAPKENAADIRAKPGTRLGLIARAANTSTLRIHELNLDFLQEVVPEGETSVRVPESEARGAQEFLDTVVPSDKRDLCVPKTFDWGKTEFDTSRYAKSCARRGTAQ